MHSNRKIVSKNKDTSSSEKKKEVQSTNQKKFFDSYYDINLKKLEKLAEKLNIPLLCKIFDPIDEDDIFLCNICRIKNTVTSKNLKRHLTGTNHLFALTNKSPISKKDHGALVQKVEETKKIQRRSEGSKDQEKNTKLNKGFIRFIGSCLKLGLSFHKLLS